MSVLNQTHRDTSPIQHLHNHKGHEGKIYANYLTYQDLVNILMWELLSHGVMGFRMYVTWCPTK